jgi:hypothetical protein
VVISISTTVQLRVFHFWLDILFLICLILAGYLVFNLSDIYALRVSFSSFFGYNGANDLSLGF